MNHIQVNWTKIRTKTENGRILGVSMTKIEDDVVLMAEFMTLCPDIFHYYLCTTLQHHRFTNKGINEGVPQTCKLMNDLILMSQALQV